MKYFFAIPLFCLYSLLTAQSEPTTPYETSPIFVDVGFGAMPHFEFFSVQFSAAVGYRFTERLGLGVEFRSTSTSGVSITRSADLLGLRVRKQYNQRWIASIAGGTVLTAGESDDGFLLYDYRSGGTYLSVDLAYQLPWGMTIGGYVTAVWGQVHDVFEWDDLSSTYLPTGRTSMDSFPGAGIKLGYAFPSRGKRR